MMAIERHDDGDETEAERLAWTVVELADRHALGAVQRPWPGGTFAAVEVLMGMCSDDEDSAESVLNRLTEFRNPQTWAVAARSQEARRPARAKALYRRAADREDLNALERLALMERHRNTADAERLHRTAVNGGGRLGPLLAHWEDTGRADEAERARRYGLEIDGSIADPWPFRPSGPRER
ncbi:hypothetical protein [Streptomyces sp. NPDC006638]|uniref:hypothetical protein n=1 Tax=Streptomyces sp. NPDC006638 TaxID=3157183 RepID=UPI0033B80CDA